MNSYYDELLSRLHDLREKYNISQSRMAEIFGMTQSHYSKVERGKSLISFSTLVRLHENKVDIDYLVTGIENKKSVLDDYVARCKEGKKADMLSAITWAFKQVLDEEGVCPDMEEIRRHRKVVNLIIQRNNKINEAASIWKIIRNDNNLTQQQMADRLKINIKKYRQIEKCNIEPDVKILTELYKEFEYLPTMMMPEIDINISYLNKIWYAFPDVFKGEVLRCIDNNYSFMRNILGLLKK